jgi:hypothetical protein
LDRLKQAGPLHNMNTSILRRVQASRYQELRHIVGKTITINGLAEIAERILPEVAPNYVADFELETSPEQIRGVIAKYGFLDLKFHSSRPLPAETRLTPSALRQLGFLGRRRLLDEQRNDRFVREPCPDPTFITELVEECVDGSYFLLFLDSEDSSSAMRRYFDKMVEVRSRGILEDADAVVFGELLEEVEGRFPLKFVVEDACLTNSGMTWFNKHQYL